MAHPLDGPRAKLDWGLQHVDRFKGVVSKTFERPDPPAIVPRAEIDAQGEWVTVRIGSLPPIPPELLLIVGDAAYNFRSALDQMVWEMRFIDSGGVTLRRDRSQFPIVGSAKDFERVGQDWLRGVSADHLTRIKRYQPYRRRNRDWHALVPHPLRLLEYLNNDHKHRLVPIVSVASNNFQLAIPMGGRDCHLDTTRSFWRSDRRSHAQSERNTRAHPDRHDGTEPANGSENTGNRTHMLSQSGSCL